jgi:hypothetical protein
MNYRGTRAARACVQIVIRCERKERVENMRLDIFEQVSG